MSTLIPYRPFIAAPSVLRDGVKPPTTVATVDVRTLCATAEIPMRVTSGIESTVFVHRGIDHLRGACVKGAPVYYVGLKEWNGSRISAIRVLEVLAHSFHDYTARECLCPMKLFCAPKRVGRPLVGKQAMSAKERMANYRKRLAT